MTLQLPACASHMPFSWVTLLANFSRASHETALIFNSCLILHQLNTKPNTIKFHKIQENNLMHLQHLLSWNKANIKHNCKSQLYKKHLSLDYISFYIFHACKIFKRLKINNYVINQMFKFQVFVI